MTRIIIDGLDALIAGLARAPMIIEDAAAAGLVEAVGDMADALADYPPELPNQRYIRTFTLRDGWTESIPTITPVSNGLEVELINPTPYGPEVEGDGTQKAIHAGRWPTVGQVRQAQEQAAFDAVARAVRQKASL